MRVSSAGSATTCARVNRSEVRVPDKMVQEELEAPSRAEFSPNVQADPDSHALSGASQGCLNRPRGACDTDVANEVEHAAPGSDGVAPDAKKKKRRKKQRVDEEKHVECSDEHIRFLTKRTTQAKAKMGSNPSCVQEAEQIQADANTIQRVKSELGSLADDIPDDILAIMAEADEFELGLMSRLIQ